MAAKKTWYFHGTTDDTWGDVANWTANHVYNVADANPTYPPWTNTSEFPDADIRKGSAYTGTDITLDVAIVASEWDGTYNATTFIGVENLSVNITLDYNLPASINGGIWTSTIYGNIECPITVELMGYSLEEMSHYPCITSGYPYFLDRLILMMLLLGILGFF